MKLRIVSALLLLATVFGAVAADARPYFAVNPALSEVPAVAQSGGERLISYRYGGYYPPPYYWHHHHRRWHRHW